MTATDFLDEKPSAEDFLNAKPSAEEFLSSPKIGEYTVDATPPPKSSEERGARELEALKSLGLRPSGQGQTFGEMVARPLFEAAKTTTSRIVQDAFDYARGKFVESAIGETGGTPEQKEKAQELIGGRSQPVSGAAKVAAGLQNVAAGTVNSFLSPLGLVTLGVGSLSVPLQRLVSVAFAANTTKHLAEESGKLSVTGLPEGTQEKTETIGSLIVDSVLTGIMFKHGIKPGETVPESKQTEVVSDINKAAEEIQKNSVTSSLEQNNAPLTAQALKEVPNAVRQQEPNESVLRPAQPEVGLPSVAEGNAKSEVIAGKEEGIGGKAKAEELNQDAARHKEIWSEMSQVGMESPEFQKLWAEAEQIKNKYGGHVPIEKPTDLWPPIQGMGGATPSEFLPTKEFVTSIKNAVVDKERESRGLAPAMSVARRDFGKVWDDAMQIVNDHPERQDQLIAELKEKPRALTDTEDALLLQRQIELQNEYEKAVGQLNKEVESGNEASVAENQARVAFWSDALLDIYNIGKRSGTESGRGLNARRIMAKEDYSLAAMETQKRAANNGEKLSDEQRGEIKRLHDKIEATQKAFDEYKAKIESQSAEASHGEAVADIVKEVEKETSRAGKSKVRDIPQEQRRIEGMLRDKAIQEAPVEEMGSLIQQLAKNFVRSGIRERNALVDAVYGAVKDIIPDIHAASEAEGKRTIMDAISGYGKYKALSKDEISVALRDLKGQMQQVGKLEDMQAKKAPAKTGVERRTPSDEERRLIQQVNEMKKKGGFNVTDPAKQLKSALDAIKTRLKNQISDLEFQVANKQKIVRDKTGITYDAEAETLRARRDELKTQYEEIFGKREMTDEQRLKMATSAVEKSIAEYERRIKENDLFPQRPESKTPPSAQLDALKVRRDALRQEFENLQDLATPKKTPEEIALQALKTRLRNSIANYSERLASGDFTSKPRKSITPDEHAQFLQAGAERAKLEFKRGLMADRLKNRSAAEKAQDTFVKWRRMFLLSSPITLAKLTSAAVQRITITPMEELAGVALSRFPGISKIAANAPREGGFSIRAEAKAMTDGFMKGLSDAGQVLKTGQSELDVLYGKQKLMPHEWTDFMGSIHGALKTTAKRNEFARSFQKRIEFNMDRGVDVTDPLVQTRIAQEAYRDANKSIFMQDNRVVAAYKRGLSALKEPNKETGKVPLGSKALATVAETMLPIVKVPTNIVAETMQYAFGAVTGSARAAKALHDGISTLPPEQADLIMREMKKGSLGAALMLTGFLLPNFVGGYYQPGEKRREREVQAGRILIGDTQIPSFLLHNPLLETLQIGATIRRVADSKLRRKDAEKQGIGVGATAGALGLLEEVPFVREMLEITKAFNPHERGAFFGELGKSILIPQLVQWIARQSDKDKKGETTKRKPETVLQHIETGIPGLRQEVPKAKPRK